MKEKEQIPVRVKVINGKTVCICICIKGCNRAQYCEPDMVVRDRFRGWQETMKRDKYGK